MIRLRSIAAELGLTFLVVALAPILTAYVVANDIFSRSIHEQKLEALTAIADAAQDRVETYVHGLITDTTTLARTPALVELLHQPDPLIQPDSATLAFLNGFSETKGYYDLLLVDQAGNIRFSLKREDDLGGNIRDTRLEGTQLAATIEAANTLLQTEVSNFAWYPPSRESAAFLAAPIFDAGVIVGNLVLQIDNRELNAIVNHYGGLGETGELLAATLDEDGLAAVAAPSRHAPDLPERALNPAAFAPLQAAMQGQAGSGRFVDYRDRDVLGVWRYLPSLNWGLLVKIDTAEFQAPIERFARISQAVMLASIGLVLFGVWLSNRLVSRPIVHLAQSVTRLEHETLPERLQVSARHEIAALVAAFNRLIASVRVHQTELEDRVVQRTAELAEANRELQAANTGLAEANRTITQYLDIIDQHVLICRLDRAGAITYVSEAFCRKSGFERQDLIGRNYWQNLYFNLSESRIREIMTTLERGEIWQGEIRHQSKDGKDYWVHEIVSPDLVRESMVLGFTSIRQDITDKKAVEELSITDALTGLYNRRHFNSVLERELGRAREAGQWLAFAIFDVDHFKAYNDNHGHAAGDEVLKRIGRLLNERYRRGRDYVFRIGGEEFAVLLTVRRPDETEAAAAGLVAAVEALELPHGHSPVSPWITISLGLRLISPDEAPVTVDQVFTEADTRLYRAKAGGRNRYVFY